MRAPPVHVVAAVHYNFFRGPWAGQRQSSGACPLVKETQGRGLLKVHVDLEIHLLDLDWVEPARLLNRSDFR